MNTANQSQSNSAQAVIHSPSETASTATSGRAKQKVCRVLHVINGEHYAGAERVQDLLGLCLPEFGYEVGYACLKPGKFPEQRNAKDNTLYDLAMKSKFDFFAAKRLAQSAKVGGYDLLHAHTPRSLLVTRIAASLAKKPFVYHLHSPSSACTTGKLTGRVNEVFERLCLGGVSQMICVSESLGEYTRSAGIDPDVVNVVPNGVPIHGELAPRETPSGTWTLGMVALFRPRKGTEVLLEAMSSLRNEGLDIRLRAVGPFEASDYEAKIHELANELGVADAIEWTGFASDVNSELGKMDIMVLPSLHGEGLPMVILEAMAAGVPVVSTRVQGVPEVLREGSGLVAEPSSAQDLAACIKRIVTGEEDWSTIREKAWQRQADRFSDRSMAKGVAAVYDRVLGE